MTFNMYGDSNHPKLNGTVQVDVKASGYTLTVTINGLDPNSLHNLHQLAGSCADQLAYNILSVDDVTANAKGTLTSVTQWTNAYLVPHEGLILIVHDNDGLPHAHIGCADLTN